MPTTLGPSYAPDYSRVPTHMSTEDFTLWLRYRDRIILTVQRLYFDVRLGGDRALRQAAGTEQQKMWYDLNAKRADVLLEYADHLVILELRTRAQPNAIGRLQTYRMLWNDDPAIKKPMSLELATDTYDPDVERLAAQLAITYTVLPG